MILPILMNFNAYLMVHSDNFEAFIQMELIFYLIIKVYSMSQMAKFDKNFQTAI